MENPYDNEGDWQVMQTIREVLPQFKEDWEKHKQEDD
jgi:hypothetical protein